MKLTDLEPFFIRYEERPSDYANGQLREWHITVPTLAEAQGIMFLCPKGCGHLVQVTFANKGVPDHLGTHNKDGKPVRWQVSGNDFTNLTTQPSILLESGCCWHGFITNGNIQ